MNLKGLNLIRASKEEISLLKTAERILMILPYKNRWQVDIEQLKNEMISKEDKFIEQEFRLEKCKIEYKEMKSMHDLRIRELEGLKIIFKNMFRDYVLNLYSKIKGNSIQKYKQ